MRVLIFILLWPLVAFSAADNEGHITGNGGDVVVCKKDGSVVSVELLDFTEARIKRKINYNLGSAELSYKEKVKLAVDRFTELSPVRAKAYQIYTDMFESESNFLTGQVLTDITDEDYSFIPAGCTVEQIVIQSEPQFPEDFRYIVNKDLWDLLDNDNKAGLVLHEVFYREAIHFYDATNSVGVRYLNSYLTADKFKEGDFRTFLDRLNRAEFKWTDIDGVYVQVKYTNISPDNNLIRARPAGTIQPIEATNFIGKIDPGILTSAAAVSFYNESKKLMAFPLYEGTFIHEEKEYEVSPKCVVRLYENRHVKGLCLSEDAELLFADGKTYTIPKQNFINFDDEGRVLSYDPM